MDPLVSIIMPAYNSEQFITDAIESVLSQTYQSWELIIVDDYSSDNTISIVEKYANIDERIKFHANTSNLGAAKTRNVAIKLSRGRFVAFLDSDDLWLPVKLEVQIEIMLSRNISFSFSNYAQINQNGDKLERHLIIPQQLSYNQYLKNTIIGCLTVVLDREQIGNIEMEDIRTSHDMALWLNILKRGHLAYGINDVLAIYRVLNSSITSSKLKAAKDVRYVYRSVERLGVFHSLIFFSSYVYHAIKKRI